MKRQGYQNYKNYRVIQLQERMYFCPVKDFWIYEKTDHKYPVGFHYNEMSARPAIVTGRDFYYADIAPMSARIPWQNREDARYLVPDNTHLIAPPGYVTKGDGYVLNIFAFKIPHSNTDLNQYYQGIVENKNYLDRLSLK